MHESVREQRPNRPVDHAGRENFLLTGLAFAFEEATRDLPSRIALLPVLYRQREEGEMRRSVSDCRGAQNNCVAVLNQA